MQSISGALHESISVDGKHKAEDQLETKLLEGLNSPESEQGFADWVNIRKEALTWLEARKKQRLDLSRGISD